MPRHGQITSTPVHVPSVLVVQDAAWPELFARCLVAATRAGVLLHRCELLAAATFAAERRPIAIVLSNAVHAMDPGEFDALARDVQATLLKVDEEVSERELEAMFVGALRERERRDEGGRYAVIRPTSVETPLGRSSQMPPSSTRAPLSRSQLPPPTSRSLPPPSRSLPPPSSRSLPPPLRSFTPPPQSRPAPASVRAGLPAPAPLKGPASAEPRPRTFEAPPSSRRIAPALPLSRTPTPVPPTSRSGGLPPNPAMPPVKAQGDAPRSGVRHFAGDPLDAAVDENPLPGVPTGARRGSAT
jgi:hypothetical protein